MEMNIYEAIASIMQKGAAVSKDKRNEQQRFMYRGIDDVMNVFSPLMAEAGIFMVPEVLSANREERQTSKGGNLIYSVLRVKYTFYASDGTSVSATVIGEGMDSGDKASNKAMAVAMKYAMFQVFCIPTEEMKDPDAETPDPSRPVAQNTSSAAAAAPSPRGEGRAPVPADNVVPMSQQAPRQAPTQVPRPGDTPAQAPEPIEKPDGYYYCSRCGNTITKHGQMTAYGVAKMALTEFGQQLCYECGHKEYQRRSGQ